MLIGVISDTHDHKDNILKAVNIMNERNVNDGDHVFLRKNLGKICKLVENGHELIYEFEGQQVYASHMPKQKTIEALTYSGNFDIVLSGHTHSYVYKKHDNGVLELNPGECCGYLTGDATFAIINTKNLKAEIIHLE